MRLCLALVLVAVMAIAACGDDDDERTTTTTTAAPPSPLRDAERDRVFAAERAIASYCTRVRAAALGQAKLPPPRAQRQALGRVDELAGLASRDPRAEVETGVSIRLFLSDLAENLEGSNCDPRLIARLDEALAVLPVG